LKDISCPFPIKIVIDSTYLILVRA